MSRDEREIIRDLAAAGLNTEQTALLFELLAARPARATSTARVQRHRERNAGNVSSVSSVSEAGTNPALTSLPSFSTSSVSEESKEGRKEAIRARASGPPPETPPDDAVTFARDLGWPADRIAAEWRRFRDWHLAHGKNRKHAVAMLAAWRNWTTSPYQQQQQGKLDGRKDHTFYSALDKLRASIEDDERRLAAGEEGGGDDLRLLPPERGE